MNSIIFQFAFQRRKNKGVPIKSVKAKIKVDPLVMQTYKSVICFLTCWLVIPLGEPFKFTSWGIGKKKKKKITE